MSRRLRLTNSKKYMSLNYERSFQRGPLDFRPIKITTGVNAYAEGAVIVECGGTKVLCTATVDEAVPPWLKGKGKGWVTAEYAMLPRATHSRVRRERDKVSGRTHEIQRLIGRALRCAVDLTKLGERQIIVDCDVLQADGGTRTASITGGYVALALALKQKELSSALISQVGAISVGLKDGHCIVDLDYAEDSTCEVDMNFVMTSAGLIVEVQGTAEHKPFSFTEMNAMTQAASAAIERIFVIQQKILN